MRSFAWLAACGLLACAPRIGEPVVVELTGGVASDRPTPWCTAPSKLDAPRVVRTAAGFGVLNPNHAPAYLAELRIARGRGSIVFTFESLYLPPHEHISVRRDPGAAPGLVSVLYLDGMGHERSARYPLTEAQTPPRLASVAADPPCRFPPPPALAPLSFTVDGATVGVPLRIRVNNPNAHRLRLEQLSTRHPSGTTTFWATTNDLTYVEPTSSVQLTTQVVLRETGAHEMTLENVDGWGRHRRADFEVFVPER